MAENRWNVGKIESGESAPDGFVSPTNQAVREFSDFARLQTTPGGSPGGMTMAGQMDGDESIGLWGNSSGRKK